MLCGGCSQASQPGSSSSVSAPAATENATAPNAEQTSHGAAPRQIIYRASLELHVEDFAATERQVNGLVKVAGGYVAQFREERSLGRERGGHWSVRVPAPKFDRFVEQVAKLGVTEQREVQADDVTEEHVDLTARIKNKQQLEQRLLELVAKRTDDIKDVIAVEAELTRVREEIERMQGRLNFLTDRVAMTTVEIAAFERRDYRPPEATFAGRINHTFGRSLEMMRQFAETWVLLFVALLPWLAVLAIVVVPFAWFVRRRLRPSAAPRTS
ncbi:MAG: DUF4349 domain-containing protein [Pirellulaceae bacterium]